MRKSPRPVTMIAGRAAAMYDEASQHGEIALRFDVPLLALSNAAEEIKLIKKRNIPAGFRGTANME
jgi:hypothetical protein